MASCNFITIIQDLELDLLEQTDPRVKEYDFNIYLIGRRPRVRVVADSASILSCTLNVDLIIDLGSSTQTMRISIVDPSLADAKIECNASGSLLYLTRKESSPVVVNPALLLDKTRMREPNLDLEVLYVGKSIGRITKRTALDRLRSHERLQRIYAENARHTPQYDVWLILCSFEYNILTFVHPKGPYDSGLADAEQLVLTSQVEDLPFEDKISLTEAALIHYFKPFYNQYFKAASFGRHSSYAEVTKSPLSSIVVTLGTSPVTSARLWIEAVEPASVHYAQVDLTDPAKYRSMFELD